MKKNVITMGRQFGSGGREIGKRLSSALGFSFYDEQLITMAAQRAEESAGTTEARRLDGSYFFTIFEEYGLENPRHSGQSLFRTATLEEAAQRLEGGMGNIYQAEITAIGIGCYFDEADETNPYCWAVLTGGR